MYFLPGLLEDMSFKRNGRDTQTGPVNPGLLLLRNLHRDVPCRCDII